ncbi:COG2426 family protein [Pyrococcus abyssi]|uniref:Small multidrug export related protein (Qace) n=1 Tax=Pyrococcus abyssi (strain GE5 / Orsay) TaxID=272844 RepID=Q9V1B6_PYRAB|nr:COG2426 family protein [Pyrococcus abyssi]CAB49433.1 Hypothetical protein PAB2022 [Pyrococcus abyssi GE5]CCE69900.1 TPA: small multidrug export related protein (qace) [Pyrococcus abyssi GE5]
MSFLEVLFLSLIPTFEGRYAVIYGIARGYPLQETLGASILGVLILSLLLPKVLPIVDIIAIKLENTRLRRIAELYINYVNRAREKARPYVERWGFIGLTIFVAIPLPGTGVWTGAIAAYFLGIRERTAMASLILGGLISIALTTIPTLGIIKI